jgi:hypothetical protein
MDSNRSDCDNLAKYSQAKKYDDNLHIDHDKWVSEKPISILQLDPADRAVLKIAGKNASKY